MWFVEIFLTSCIGHEHINHYVHLFIHEKYILYAMKLNNKLIYLFSVLEIMKVIKKYEYL